MACLLARIAAARGRSWRSEVGELGSAERRAHGKDAGDGAATEGGAAGELIGRDGGGMMATLYRRPLPAGTITFASAAGRQLFGEALAGGGMDGYFRLAEQFHTQAEPAFCGLGSLVVALNALAIDPGRLWKGPWRWFAEELLDCCVSLDEVRRRGVDLDELACLARCNGAEVDLHRPAMEPDDASTWRQALLTAARGEAVVIASYDRAALAQSGGGHFSPIGGYHAARDLVLVLDVARFKYPPHWLPAESLLRAMHAIDPATGRARGWMVLRPRAHGVSLGFTLSCEGTGWERLAARLAEVLAQAEDAADLSALAGLIAPLTENLLLKHPVTTAHQTALAGARAALQGLSAYPRVVEAVGAARAEAVTILALALVERLPARLVAELTPLADEAAQDNTLSAELVNLRAQLEAVTAVARVPRCRPHDPR